MAAVSVFEKVGNMGLAWMCLVVLLAGGCASFDRQEFKSTPMQPVTVLVEDQLTDELLWSFDVPAYHMLVLFTPAEGDIPLHWQSQDIPVSSMSWELWDLRRQWWELFTVSSGKVDMPGHPILIRSQLRASGELPDTLPTSPEGQDQAQSLEVQMPARAAEREAAVADEADESDASGESGDGEGDMELPDAELNDQSQ